MSKNPNDIHENSLNIHQRIASLIADVLGSPYTIYVFTLTACLSLPAVLVQSHIVPASFFPAWIVSVSLIALVAWVAQTFIQLVSLAVLQAKAVLDGKHAQRIADETHANALLAEQNVEEIKSMLEQVFEHLFDIKEDLK